MTTYTTTVWDKALKRIYPHPLHTLWYEHATTVAKLKKDQNFEGEMQVIPMVNASGMATGDFNTANNNMTVVTPVRFELTTLYKIYEFGILDNLAMLRAKGNAGATGAMLKSAFDMSNYRIGRLLSSWWWGNGGGAIGQADGNAFGGGGTSLVLADASNVAFFEIGMSCQLSATDGTSGAVRAGTDLVVSAVNRVTGTITFSAGIVASIPAAGLADYIFPTGTFGQAARGFFAWCPKTDTLAATTYLTVDRSADINRFAGTRVAANGATIEDALIDAMATLQRVSCKPKDLLLGPMRFAEFQKNATSRGYTVTAKKSDRVDITFSSFSMPTPNGPLNIYVDQDLTDDYGVLIDFDNWSMVSAGPVPHFATQSGDKMIVDTGSDSMRYRQKAYLNFKCTKPQHNALISFGPSIT